MSKGFIFISYRRDDSAGFTRAIYEHLAQRFSRDRIFMDVDGIEPGLPFDQVINRAVGRCECLLAMIGKDWMQRTAGGTLRIENPKDFVRTEIAAALSRNIRVIPVLLDGTVMPAPDVLPEPLRPLAMRNAIEISNTRFASDVDRLADAVSRALGEPDAPRHPKTAGSRRPVLIWLLGGSAALAMLPVGFLAFRIGGEQRASDPVQADWRFCQKCQSLFFDGFPAKGVCPAGGGHSAAGFMFILPHDVPGPGQAAWRFCEKCNAMFFDGYPTKGVCPAGDAHRAEGFNFVLPHA